MQLPEIIYQDHHLVAVNKPARVPVASENSGDVTLLDMVRAWNTDRQTEGRKGYCVPIHFLDRPVSGVILFALSSKAASRLNAFFRERKIKKTYVAITSPIPDKDEGFLEHWLVKDAEENFSRVVARQTGDAKKCSLEYKVLARFNLTALVEVHPITGRSHQIRAQMAAIGCPLIGDVKYGAPSGWDGRVALHAAHLEFLHPVGSQILKASAPLPSYWREIWPSAFPIL